LIFQGYFPRPMRLRSQQVVHLFIDTQVASPLYSSHAKASSSQFLFYIFWLKDESLEESANVPAALELFVTITEATMKKIWIAVVMGLLLAAPCQAAESGFKQGAKEVGQGIKEGAKEVGQGVKDAGKEMKKKGLETGQAIKEESKEISQKIKEDAKEVKQEAQKKGRTIGEWFRETGKKTGDAFRQMGKELRKFFTGN
jgi:gas vesicle protein